MLSTNFEFLLPSKSKRFSAKPAPEILACPVQWLKQTQRQHLVRHAALTTARNATPAMAPTTAAKIVRDL